MPFARQQTTGSLLSLFGRFANVIYLFIARKLWNDGKTMSYDECKVNANRTITFTSNVRLFPLAY